MSQETTAPNQVEQAVVSGNAYDVIRQRLTQQGNELFQHAEALNASRIEEFGASDYKIIERHRFRTENNCLAKDLVLVGDLVIFGYNVFLGLKRTTQVADVFSVFKAKEIEAKIEFEPINHKKTFLADLRFVSDFEELYTYYKHTQLSQLVVKDSKLLASFQIGERATDIRVFRWSISADGQQVEYIDNRGERDIQLPPNHDFEWIETSRDDVVEGRNEHINILDTLFVDTCRGDLTIKVENNTNVGLGLYSEPVEDASQSLDDADFSYAQLGQLILLKIKPFAENDTRYFVFNPLNQKVLRIDSIGDSCVQLPEDHGFIFPGGYYLATGEYKKFDDDIPGLKFKRSIKSPNGEDVLYIFYQPDDNLLALYSYNLIAKTLQTPIFGHGYGLYDDGRLLTFFAEKEPTRVHPVQIWQTPYYSDEFASNQPISQTFFGRIGNAELVRGISELFSIVKLISKDEVTANHFHEISQRGSKVLDQFYWLTESDASHIQEQLNIISNTAELVIDEFEKVESIREKSSESLTQAQANQKELLRHLDPQSWHTPQEYVDGLDRIRMQQGHLLTIREQRYIDQAAIDSMNQALSQQKVELEKSTVSFLSTPSALKHFQDAIKEIEYHYQECDSLKDLKQDIQKIESLSHQLDTLSGLMANIQIEDATVHTDIVERISSIYAQLNQLKANVDYRSKNLGKAEAAAKFGAQFKLFGQSVNHAIGTSTTPDLCDEQLSRLLAQLEELESQFSDFDEYMTEILEKREQVVETFESHKQQLIDKLQRKAQSIFDTAERLIASITRRSQKFVKADELNSFFASDPLLAKIRQQVAQLRDLGDSVKADDLDSKIKSLKDQSIRSLRDKSDIYEDGGKVIKLGPSHKFSVNTQALDLTIVPKQEGLYYHLTGTDYYELVNAPELIELQQYWDFELSSESPSVYRAEYLAVQILDAAIYQTENLSWQVLESAHKEQSLNKIIKVFCETRYKEGYEKGIHDVDAEQVLGWLVSQYKQAGVLRFSGQVRAKARVFWSHFQHQDAAKLLVQVATNAMQLSTKFANHSMRKKVAEQIGQHMQSFFDKNSIQYETVMLDQASQYLLEEISQPSIQFAQEQSVAQALESLKLNLESQGLWADVCKIIDNAALALDIKWLLLSEWIDCGIDLEAQQNSHLRDDIVAHLLCQSDTLISTVSADLTTSISPCMGNHPRIKERTLSLVLDDLLDRVQRHQTVTQQEFLRFQKVRSEIMHHRRSELRLEEFKAKPLTSFVRNKLINEVYLPIIGDNLAKQMGTIGESKRSDLMGMLLMISPPGYGKTTLMEYVADRLGLIFMKINCPSIGHDVTSIDPKSAQHSAAKQELEKLNLALEMGNNVMLYLDDIQHTHPEFLQKFISLCDGTRRIEGVWQGQSKTYDMRGKKFCVVMAGNPYTESGDIFQIPDMLANRADVYNLGDVLGGKEDVFSLSYIENSLSSNATLAPLATRDMQDIYRFIDMAQGKPVNSNELSYSYSKAEVDEITQVLKHMLHLQSIVWKVNQQYIVSAAQADSYRTEPPFKLQGSYRNMNKLAEKVSAIMTEDELQRLLDDHYLGESQLLTSGAEENLLKLGELRDILSESELQRWAQIKDNFQKNASLGGSDADVGSQMVAQLYDLVRAVGQIGGSNEEQTQTASLVSQQIEQLKQEITGYKTAEHMQASHQAEAALVALTKQVAKLAKSEPRVEVINQPVPGIDDLLKAVANSLESSIFPLMKIMSGKIDIDLGTHNKMQEVLNHLKELSNQNT
jgi:hypothetical protein